MKKAIYFLMLLCIVLSACSKKKDENVEPQKEEVKKLTIKGKWRVVGYDHARVYNEVVIQHDQNYDFRNPEVFEFTGDTKGDGVISVNNVVTAKFNYDAFPLDEVKSILTKSFVAYNGNVAMPPLADFYYFVEKHTEHSLTLRSYTLTQVNGVNDYHDYTREFLRVE